ncbi:filamentous hemagglutinin N-terminal domain-containing protein [Citrobacter freundii]|nr:filamentous hemagglutinin N-terminal domain-containing protein [Citrobacter freundii]
MNRIYKLKFDTRRNELVVVSEITAGTGKEKNTGHIAGLTVLSPFKKLLGTLTPVAMMTGLMFGLLPAMVLAADLPAGGQIVGGQGSITTSGNQMTIRQQTQSMATDWYSFDIGKNSTVQFVQPDSSSVALNRVTGAGGSQIMGTLKANGQVFILNPNGVLFGKDARVNVAGLVASTKNMNTADFMNGQYTLSGEGHPGAQVVNQGSLTTTKAGYIVLAGERVSNSGNIVTPGGKTVLAAGKTVTLQLDNGGLTSVSVNGSVVNALVENRGLISATNGQVYLTAKGQDMLLNTVTQALREHPGSPVILGLRPHEHVTDLYRLQPLLAGRAVMFVARCFYWTDFSLPEWLCLERYGFCTWDVLQEPFSRRRALRRFRKRCDDCAREEVLNAAPAIPYLPVMTKVQVIERVNKWLYRELSAVGLTGYEVRVLSLMAEGRKGNMSSGVRSLHKNNGLRKLGMTKHLMDLYRGVKVRAQLQGSLADEYITENKGQSGEHISL